MILPKPYCTSIRHPKHIPIDDLFIVENVEGDLGRKFFFKKTRHFLPIICPQRLPENLWNSFIKQHDTPNQTLKVQFAGL